MNVGTTSASGKTMYFLAVCLIAKNEGRYLQEWLEYHILVGVEHFFIFDNDSTDRSRDIYRTYGDVVTIIPWPYRGGQQKNAYRHYIDHLGHCAEWTAFIDADEFLVSKGTDSLVRRLRQMAHCSGILINWTIFGTNGYAEPPAGLVIANYTAAHTVAPQRNHKTICRTAAVNSDLIESPHRFVYRSPDAVVVEAALDDMSVYHYMLHSRACVYRKVMRGDAWSVHTEQQRQADVERAVADLLGKYDCTDTRDTYMFRFAERVAEAIRNRPLGVRELDIAALGTAGRAAD